MNDHGDVTGTALVEGDAQVHAFLWRDGAMNDIQPVDGDICSIAHFVNDSGQVVGTSGGCGVPFELHGFLWQPGGSVINLNDFVPAGTDLVITDGETINDRGEIAGSGQLPNGDFHAIVLIPCDREHGGVSADCLEARPSTASGPVPRSAAAVSGPSQLNARDSALGALRRSSRLHRLSQFRAGAGQ